MAGVDSIIRVTSSVLSGGVALARPFGAGLLITTDDTLPAGGDDKIRSFETASEASGYFPARSAVLAAVQAWHAQSPAPQPLYVVRWANASVSTTLVGANIADSGTPANLATPIPANAAFKIDGGTDIELNSAQTTTVSNAASRLQAALRGAGDDRFTGVTVTAVNGRMNLVLAGASTISASFGAPDGGANAAELLGLDSGASTVLRIGSDAETVTRCIEVAETLQPNKFYFVARDNGTPATDPVSRRPTDSAISEHAGDNGLFFFMQSTGDGVLTAGETTSRAAIVSALESARTVGTWSRVAATKHISAAAKLSAVDLDQPDSLITLKFRSLTGETADSLLPAEAAELNRKRLNRYTTVSGVPIYSEGYTFDPDTWADVRFWLDWLTSSLETKLFELLVNNGRVPFTQFGMALIKDTMTRVLENGVKNGGIAPGTVSAAMRREIQLTTGNAGFDGNLTNGYLIWCKPLSTLSQTDRDARIAPKAYVWLKGSSAIHFVDIALTFEN
ncbi:MAG: DUF3383 family protein [Rhodococcus sp.]|nr:DUF3383 family protein [Rhodococcus sp. (in: high G+C Gram-positive bacteria)]